MIRLRYLYYAQTSILLTIINFAITFIIFDFNVSTSDQNLREPWVVC